MKEQLKLGKKLNNSSPTSLFKKKIIVDKITNYFFAFIAIICSLIVIFVALILLVKGLTPFFKKYHIDNGYYSLNPGRFLFGNTWFKTPNIYSVGFIIINTIVVTGISILFATPIAILTALFTVKIAPKWLSYILNTIIELLAAIPSVIYGLFGLGVLSKLTNGISNIFSYQSPGGLGLLTSSSVLAIMIIPTITMLSANAIKSVRKDIELGSLALGASKGETYFKAIIPAAKSGIFQGVIFGIGRALGEATAVSLVCGNSTSGPNFNPFDVTSTLTTTMLNSIHETTGLDYDVRFSLGLVLIILIFLTNILLSFIKNKIGRQR